MEEEEEKRRNKNKKKIETIIPQHTYRGRFVDHLDCKLLIVEGDVSNLSPRKPQASRDPNE